MALLVRASLYNFAESPEERPEKPAGERRNRGWMKRDGEERSARVGHERSAAATHLRQFMRLLGQQTYLPHNCGRVSAAALQHGKMQLLQNAKGRYE